MKIIDVFLFFLILSSGCIFSGCFSFSTLQTAETLPPGRIEAGVGYDGMVEVGGRVGVFSSVDAGVKYCTLYPSRLPSRLIFIDGKYQLWNSGIDGSFDIGYSIYHKNDIITYGYYPMLLVGQKHWYVGIKGNIISTSGSIDLFGNNIPFSGSGYFATSVVAGGMIGTDNIKLLIEVNTFITRDSHTYYIPALGLYLGF